MIIDTHCHAGINWFEPVDNLLFKMRENNVGKAVIIQHSGSGNNYLFKCLEDYPEKFRIFPIINWDSNKIISLQDVMNKGASGIRIYLNYNEIFEKEGIDFCNLAGDLGLSLSVAGSLDQFSSIEFNNLVRECKETKFIIEHLADVGNYIKSRDKKIVNDGLSMFKSFLEISDFDNAYVKIPGLGELSNRPQLLSDKYPFNKDNLGLIKLTLDSFGSEHLMWGSDFPPVSNREGYSNALNGIKNLDFLSNIDKKNLFTKVPERLFF